ncbi:MULTISPECIES: hypothetical protein [Natrialbaceae]|uniref:hypothetical protein n=1 Tax=Natrialbaceae TaxID=1644061 RepID=UPI00207CCD71|nr:hypothetical protein [Natronococcus sp. CG52]
MDRFVALSEGNPGAATVLGAIVKQRPGEVEQVIETLEELNMGGPRIWLGYKDYCEQDLNQFVECVLEGDDEMFELVNERSAPDALEVGLWQER